MNNQEKLTVLLSLWKLRFLVMYFFFSFLKGCFLIFANIFVISVLKSYTVVMKQRYFKYDLVVSLDF